MNTKGKQSLDNIGTIVNRLANRALAVMGAVIFLYLSWYAFCRTQYMDPLGIELPFNVPDSKLQNLVVAFLAVLAMAGLMWAEEKLPGKAQRWIAWVSVAVAMVWIAAASFWWIHSAAREPLADQKEIYLNAAHFREGNYGGLERGAYLDRFPRQLGLIALTEILYSVAGNYNYFAFETMCAVMTPFIVLFGYLALRELTDRMSVAVFYSLTMLGCLPMVFYTSWMYGEIPGAFFSIAGGAMLFHYNNKRRVGWLVGGIFALSAAYLVRATAIVLVIAAVIAMLVKALAKKDVRLLVAALFLAALPRLSYAGISQMYEIRSGIEKSAGLSAWSGIALGVQESVGRYGWDHDNYEYIVYWGNDFDKEAAQQEYLRDIRARLDVFRADPSYAHFFFREKVLSQWNEPLYQALYFGDNYVDGEWPDEDSFVYRLNTVYLPAVLRICDRLQMVLYLGMVFYFVWGIRKDDDLVRHTLAVSVTGGVFLSIIWEAKARYIFPYYMVMFPIAAQGYRCFVLAVKGRIDKGVGR